MKLLPTPDAYLGSKGGSQHPDKRKRGGHQVSIADQAEHDLDPTNWGPYAPAIERWEAVLWRPAPRPTEPTGRNGAERLSPRFVEWMMGVPEGWVTGEPELKWRMRILTRMDGNDRRPVGMRGSIQRWVPSISRNDQLKMLGNGVVTQQATAALRDMLGVSL